MERAEIPEHRRRSPNGNSSCPGWTSATGVRSVADTAALVSRSVATLDATRRVINRFGKADSAKGYEIDCLRTTGARKYLKPNDLYVLKTSTKGIEL